MVRESCVNSSAKAGVNVQTGAQVMLKGNTITKNKDGVNILAAELDANPTSAKLSGNKLLGNRQHNVYYDPACKEHVKIDSDNSGIGNFSSA